MKDSSDLVNAILEYFAKHPTLKPYFDFFPALSIDHPVIQNFGSRDDFQRALEHFQKERFASTWLKLAKEHIEVYRIQTDLHKLIEDALPGIIAELVDGRKNSS